MECDDATLFQKWVIHWQDLVDFQIVPVWIKDAETMMKPFIWSLLGRKPSFSDSQQPIVLVGWIKIY